LEEQSEEVMFERIATVVNKASGACLQKEQAVWVGATWAQAVNVKG
jgi:hypothetical protein